MTIKPYVAATCAAALSLSAGAAAFAQAPATGPAPLPVTHGPPIPTLCTLSVEAVIGTSTVGKHVDTRMNAILTQVRAELNGEETALQNEGKALDAQRATLDVNTFEQRAAALQVKGNTLQRKAQQREREIQATQQKAIGRIGTEMDPLIRQVYQQRGCSILINRSSLLIANPAMDITPAVTTALNAKITQFAFDRERLDQQPPGAQTGATRPAAPAPAPRR